MRAIAALALVVTLTVSGVWLLFFSPNPNVPGIGASHVMFAVARVVHLASAAMAVVVALALFAPAARAWIADRPARTNGVGIRGAAILLSATGLATLSGWMNLWERVSWGSSRGRILLGFGNFVAGYSLPPMWTLNLLTWVHVVAPIAVVVFLGRRWMDEFGGSGKRELRPNPEG